jgi:hypothetical protein
MLTTLGRRGYEVDGERGQYRSDPDTETDPDADGKRAKGEANQRFQRTERRR